MRLVVSDRCLTYLSITLIFIGSWITYTSLTNGFPSLRKIDLYHRGNLNPLFSTECVTRYRDSISASVSFVNSSLSGGDSTQQQTLYLEDCYTGSTPIDKDMVIVHYHEDINWVYTYFDQDKHNKRYRSWRKIILSRDNFDNTIFNVLPNIGYEFYSYLWYIVHFYHTLPPSILLVHGHESSWHIFNNHVPTIIQNLNYSSSVSFINLNFNRYFWITNDTDHRIYGRQVEAEDSNRHNRNVSSNDYDKESFIPWEIRQYRNIYKVWYALHFDRTFGSIPESFGVHCCGQFYLRRELIHRLPLSFWLSIYNWIRTEQYLSLPVPLQHRDMGFVMEYLMPFLLHGKIIESRIRHPCNEGYLLCDNLPVTYQVEITPCCTDKFIT